MHPLLVDLDSVMEEDDQLEIARTHSESVVGMPDHTSLLFRDVWQTIHHTPPFHARGDVGRVDIGASSGSPFRKTPPTG